MSISKTNHEGYDDPTAYEALCRIEEIEREARRKYKYRPLVFICSPLAGDYKRNKQNARRYSRFAVQRGRIPFAPHLLFPQFMDDRSQEQRNLGLFFGLVMMSKCDEMWVFGRTFSHGMRLEIAKAEVRGMRIRFFNERMEEIKNGK